MIEGRVHDRFDQYAGDVRDLRRPGRAAAVGGRGRDGVRRAAIPTISGISLDAPARRRAGGGPRHRPCRPPADRRPAPELVVLPREDGSFTLTWLAHARSRPRLPRRSSSMPGPGDEVWRYSLLHTQSAVGVGTGVLGERKKLSTRQEPAAFFAERHAPAADPDHARHEGRPRPGRYSILDGDIAPAQATSRRTPTTRWTDGAGRRRARRHRLHLRLLLQPLQPARHRQQQPPDPDHHPSGQPQRSAGRCPSR